jgi:hypothetical protein
VFKRVDAAQVIMAIAVAETSHKVIMSTTTVVSRRIQVVAVDNVRDLRNRVPSRTFLVVKLAGTTVLIKHAIIAA